MFYQELPPGLAVDVGHTHYRSAINNNGELSALNNEGNLFDMNASPRTSEEFYDQLASSVTVAQELGAEWAIAGLPCLVTNLENEDWAGEAGNPASAFHGEKRFVQAELRSRGVDPHFPFRTVNDVDQFTYAAAARKSTASDKKVLGVGIGSGLGTGFVRRGSDNQIWQTAELLLELGAFSDVQGNTYEELLSGPAFSTDISNLSSKEQEAIWFKRGNHLGNFIVTNSLILGPDLVVIGGGAGAARRNKLAPGLNHFMDTFDRTIVNYPRSRYKRPRVEYVHQTEADHFALYGAVEVARSNFYQGPKTK